MIMRMNLWTATISSLFVTLAAIAAPASFDYGDGRHWTGETGQSITVTYTSGGRTITVDGVLEDVKGTYIAVVEETSGRSRTHFIYLTELQSISTEGDEGGGEAQPNTSSGASADLKAVEQGPEAPPAAQEVGDLPRGVFVLPLTDMVGQQFREVEIRQIGEHADKFGPGQIIVLDIDSGGGMVYVWDRIRDEIMELRKRHRVVAWIRSAISAAASTAMCCHEIYFRSTGGLGSCTMWSGNMQAAPPGQQERWIWELEQVLTRGGRSPLFAGAMTRPNRHLSYDRDEETGEVTLYSDGSGATPLVDFGDTLTLTADQAIDSGFGDGIADTEAELATLLDLPEWVEVDDYGRKIAARWHETFERSSREINELYGELGGNVQARDARQRIGLQIRAGKKLMELARKLGSSAMFMRLGEDQVEVIRRQIEELKHQLQQM